MKIGRTFILNYYKKCDRKILSKCSLSTVRQNRPDKKSRLKSASNVPSSLRKEKCDVDKIRNVGIIAHIDAGKTTTTERMLYLAGITHYMGNVDSGDTVTDYLTQERERGITITSAAITFNWESYRINLIDTPGHVDFTLEVERSLRVLDGAVVIMDASKGVEAQTLKVWSQARKFNVPSIIYLNKMDKPSASVDKCLGSIEEKLKVKPILIQDPIGYGKSFSGIADLTNMQQIIWSSENSDGKNFTATKIDKSAPSYSHFSALREKLIGTVADCDSDLSEKILAETSLDNIAPHLIQRALRRCVLSSHGQQDSPQSIIPVLCGSSAQKIGVQPLLSAVCKFLPSPLERPRLFAKFYSEGTLCALAFKIISHPFLGSLTFLRLYGGTLKPGTRIYNVNRGFVETVPRIYVPHSNEMVEIAEIGAGNIACVPDFSKTITGDTLVDSEKAAYDARLAYEKWTSSKHNSDLTHEIEMSSNDKLILTSIEAPDPVFFCSIEPPSQNEQKKFDVALETLVKEDPSLRVSTDPDTLQTILRGMGELQIEIVKDRLRTEFGLDVFLGAVQIGYKETLKPGAVVEDSHEITDFLNHKQSRIVVQLKVKHMKGAGALKTISVANVQHDYFGHLANIPDHWKQAVKEGCLNACYHGPLLGYPVQDIHLSLTGLTTSAGINSSLVNACAHACLSKIFQQMPGHVLEPVMKLTLNVPENYVGTVQAELARRRTNVDKSDWFDDDQTRLLECTAPLAELVGFAKCFRTMTSGNGELHMQLAGYEQMCSEEVENLKAKLSGQY